MTLQILDAPPDPEKVARRIRQAIENAIAGASVEVGCASPGHFEIRVSAEIFAGESKLRQHQLVYAAIAELMSGDTPPVHAVDRLECQAPGQEPG